MKPEKMALGSDHAGVDLKNDLINFLEKEGICPLDCGSHTTDRVDYPDYAEQVAHLVSKGQVPQGILICGTGIGMSIVANKFPNVRAALCTTPLMAKMARAHNNANILCLGARIVDASLARDILQAWLSQLFEGGRHECRVSKISQLDRGIIPPSSANWKERSL